MRLLMTSHLLSGREPSNRVGNTTNSHFPQNMTRRKKENEIYFCVARFITWELFCFWFTDSVSEINQVVPRIGNLKRWFFSLANFDDWFKRFALTRFSKIHSRRLWCNLISLSYPEIRHHWRALPNITT